MRSIDDDFILFVNTTKLWVCMRTGMYKKDCLASQYKSVSAQFANISNGEQQFSSNLKIASAQLLSVQNAVFIWW